MTRRIWPLAADLRSRSDLYIICALNRDVGTFDRMSEALHYHMYQGVLLVNNGQFGGSSFYMPFEKPFHRQVFQLTWPAPGRNRVCRNLPRETGQQTETPILLWEGWL